MEQKARRMPVRIAACIAASAALAIGGLIAAGAAPSAGDGAGLVQAAHASTHKHKWKSTTMTIRTSPSYTAEVDTGSEVVCTCKCGKTFTLAGYDAHFNSIAKMPKLSDYRGEDIDLGNGKKIASYFYTQYRTDYVTAYDKWWRSHHLVGGYRLRAVKRTEKVEGEKKPSPRADARPAAQRSLSAMRKPLRR